MENNLLTDEYKNIIMTIVSYIDNVESIDRHVDSIFNNNIFQSNNVEIIIMDPICSNETFSKCGALSAKYENNVRYFPVYELTLAECYNLGILYSKGLYINFSLASSFFDENSLDHLYDCLVCDDFPSLVGAAPWTVNELEIYSQYRISPRIYDGKRKIIDLRKDSSELLLCLNAFFIKKTAIYGRNGIQLFEELEVDTEQNYIIRLLCQEKKYLYVSYAFYNYTVPLEDNTSAFLGQYDISWYLQTMLDSFYSINRSDKNLVDNEWSQRMVLWMIFSRLNCNYNDRSKGIINKDNIYTFFNRLSEVLDFIDDRLIWERGEKQTYNIPRTLRLLLFKIKDKKYFQPLSLDVHDGGIYRNNYRICDISREYVLVDVINYDNRILTIEGRFSIGDFELIDCVEYFVLINGTPSIIEKCDIYPDNSVFGVTYQKKVRFTAKIPVDYQLSKVEISFGLRMNGDDYQLSIRPDSVHSHISNLQGAYFRLTDNKCLCLKDKYFVILDEDKKGFLSREKIFETNIADEGNEYAARALEIREGYFRQIRTKSKEIWITFDKLYKAGDNGEYMFHYIRKNIPNIEIFYLIKEDSPDYQRLINSDKEHILVWGKNDTVIKMLLADVILATHANVVSNAGIEKKMIPYLADLFNPFIVCIQHGLTVQNIAQYQNRIFDNTKFYVLASQNEYRNINTPVYGYNDNMLKLTGMARYDGLKSNSLKQVLITPTWRRNVANSNIAHFKKAHNAYFKHSEYFRLYNKLINDKRLIDCAKEYGYKIVYLLHPAVSSQIEDFGENKNVEIIPAAGNMNYEKILTESALMVTDYSGVQFDFAYMKKPILYYHPKSLPPHYSQSEAYKYDRDAFGPIIAEHDTLIDELCDYISNNCIMKEEYRKRVQQFFAFDDFNNCKRIYEAVRNKFDEYKGVKNG